MMDSITYDGASRMMHSAIFGQVIILIVFIPILSLQGVEGKMFRPMALAFSFAILGAMFLCLTWLPVITSLFLKPQKQSRRSISSRVLKLVTASYLPVIKWSISHKRLVLSMSLTALLGSAVLLMNIGGEFVPTLDEGDFVIQPALKTGTSLSKTVELTTRMEKILREKFPEVQQVVCRIGAAEVPTDPMSMEEIDMIIKLKPKNEWTSASSKEELADKIKASLSVIPGVDYEFTQPIEMRFNELITGVRSDIAIKIFGDDLRYMNDKALEIKSLVEHIPGAADVILEKTTGLPQMSVRYNRALMAQYGIDAATLNTYLATAFGGEAANNVFEGEKRFDMVLRLDSHNRRDIDDIRSLQVALPNGSMVALSQLADISLTTGPAKISRENTHRRVVVSVNVRNRDLQSVVKDIQHVVENKVDLRPGTYIKYGGQFENLQNATRRLTYAVPIALALIFIFLHFAFKSLKDTIMIFSAVPLSIIGGILALWIRGMSFSISAGVGFIALFGIAVLNGLVLIEHLKHLLSMGMTDLRKLIIIGTTDRLRPVMLTAASAAMGFLPMAVSTGAGAEVQRPLATVVIGGLITSTMLTMIALPLLFMIIHDREGLKYKIIRLLNMRNFMLPICLLLSTATGFSQHQPLSLHSAIATALDNNMMLKSYQLRVDERKAMSLSRYEIDKTRVYYGFDQANEAENGHPLHTIGIEQQMPFPTVFATQNKGKRIETAIAENELEHQKRLLVKDVSAAYMQLIYHQARLNHFMRIDSIYRVLAANAGRQYRMGDISMLEQMNITARQKQSSNEISQLEYDIKDATARLKALMQSEGDFVAVDTMAMLEVQTPDMSSQTDLRNRQLQCELLGNMAKQARQQMLPDLTMGYFYADNSQANRRGYHGFEVGLSIPLFAGAQKSKVKASKIAAASSQSMLDNDRKMLSAKYEQLRLQLAKHLAAINYYQQTGKSLSEEIIRTATRNYEAGAISFYEFAISVETSTRLKLDYYDALNEYNKTALEINYITL